MTNSDLNVVIYEIENHKQIVMTEIQNPKRVDVFGKGERLKIRGKNREAETLSGCQARSRALFSITTLINE